MAVMDMYYPFVIFLLIVFGMESIISLLGNGFIIVVNGYSWLRSRRMLPCDFLLTTMSLSRFLLQSVSMISQLEGFRFPKVYVHSKEHQIFVISWTYLNVVSLWCATWLNVFYCVKVTNFAHPLFVRVKLRIGVLVPRFLGTSLLAFIICSIYPVIWYLEGEKRLNLTGQLPEDTSQTEDHNNLDIFHFYFMAVGFSICLTASGVLLLSLWRHKKNLKKSGLGMKDLGTRAHLRVMKPLLLALFFYIVNFAAMSLSLTGLLKHAELGWLIVEIFMTSYPSAHSVILILTNPKLRKVYVRVLNCRSCP